MSSTTKLDGYLTPTETAKRLGVAVHTLDMWRWKKKGPSFERFGWFILYPISAIDDYENARTRARSKSSRTRARKGR